MRDRVLQAWGQSGGRLWWEDVWHAHPVTSEGEVWEMKSDSSWVRP